jgi:hypothetical protein
VLSASAAARALEPLAPLGQAVVVIEGLLALKLNQAVVAADGDLPRDDDLRPVLLLQVVAHVRVRNQRDTENDAGDLGNDPEEGAQN